MRDVILSFFGNVFIQGKGRSRLKSTSELNLEQIHLT